MGGARLPARPFEQRAGVQTALGFAAGVLAAVVAGLLEVRYGVKVIGGVLGVIGLAFAVRRRAYGVLLGVALLANLNGLPGVNVNRGQVAISRFQDVFAVAILLGAFYVVASGKVGPRSSLQRLMYLASFSLGGWWLLTWARTGFFDGVPPVLAGRFARDFLFFALSLPLLCDVFVTYPRLRKPVFWTLGTGAAVYAVAQIAQSRAHVPVDFILHARHYTIVQGTSRVYSPMNVLVRAGFALACGALLLAPTSRLRRRAIAPTLLFGAAMLLQLTRAAYFGAALGFVTAGAIWWFRRDSIRMAARKQLVLVPVFAVLALGVGAALSASERHILSSVATRALSGYSDANSTSGTVSVRVNVGKEMLRVLGQDWPVGVGFLHPAARFFPSLPNGSIRDSDLGVLNALMLMGAVGAILIYIPLLLVLRELARGSGVRAPTDDGDEWLRLGSTIWIIAVLASSLTLGELFSFGGLQLSAVLLAIGASVAVGRRAAEPAVEAE
jgi:hypothetical protein